MTAFDSRYENYYKSIPEEPVIDGASVELSSIDDALANH